MALNMLRFLVSPDHYSSSLCWSCMWEEDYRERRCGMVNKKVNKPHPPTPSPKEKGAKGILWIIIAPQEFRGRFFIYRGAQQQQELQSIIVVQLLQLYSINYWQILTHNLYLVSSLNDYRPNSKEYFLLWINLTMCF